ncbi:MAG: SH3 domain-containing protein [Jannaschia sp.]
MLRLTLILVASLYGGFVIWGAPVEADPQMAASQDAVVVGSGAEYDQPTILNMSSDTGVDVTRDATNTVIVPEPAVIAASAPAPGEFESSSRIGEPVIVSLIQTETGSESAEAVAPAKEELILRVTGSRVNMRSGPSTSNAVVGSLREGTLAAALGSETNGWIEIRDVSTGETGFMAARFLEPS